MIIPPQINEKNIPIDPLDISHLSKDVHLSILREDCIHPIISGNKWRKLKYNFLEIQHLKKKKLLTFGGPYSNHIHATAYAGKLYNIQTIGIIRGEEKVWNATLDFAQNQGMQLHYVSRKTYRLKTHFNFIEQLKKEFGDFHLVPEGGANILGIKGCNEIIHSSAHKAYTHIALACGTGTTISGIIQSMYTHQHILGFAVLKGGFLTDQVRTLLNTQPSKTNLSTSWEIINDYHFGGYAKTNPSLIEFMYQFEKRYKIPIEQVYTAKMLYGLFDYIKKNIFLKAVIY